MSQLIRSRKAMTTTPTTTATTPTEMDHKPVNPIDPVSPSTAKVTRVTNDRITIGYDERYRAAPTAEQHSALVHDIGHKAMPEEVKNTVHNHLSVTLEEGCPKEFEDQENSWVWLCSHFQESGYVKKAKTNKINREKKTLLHHSGSRPFSYRMEVQRKVYIKAFISNFKMGSKFPEINIFADVYVWSRDELTESLHSALQESAFQLPPDMPIEFVDPLEDVGFHILTETLDQTFDQGPRTYCRGMGNARRQESGTSSSSQLKGVVTALTQEVAGLSELRSYKTHMSLIVQALSSSRIHFLNFSAPPPSEPLHPEHTQQSDLSTSNPVPSPTPFQQQDYQAPSNDLPIDYASFFFLVFFSPAFFLNLLFVRTFLFIL
ncbi:hypothetical protein D8674_031410 [Pyrus ussuriensis x Pyrus communis]|uniref:Uncharacterized protein n=1 Tax=Pyrus ussuriensis x Pyrus communis TaxID=2448454 RepID=A0A5N5F435_9ROSA|nr:hypothetical protein D8674_031410 [Pyrus ussuriensis x Pyrus communis]